AVFVYSCLFVSIYLCFFFFSSRRRHTRFSRDWSSDVCSSDLTSRKSTTKRARCACLSPFLVAPRPSNSISARSKRPDSQPRGARRVRDGRLNPQGAKHGEEDRRLYQAASTSW